MFELIRQLVNLYGATGREAGVADAVSASTGTSGSRWRSSAMRR